MKKYWICIDPGMYADSQGLMSGNLTISDGENPENVVDDSKWEEITEEEYKSLINNQDGI